MHQKNYLLASEKSGYLSQPRPIIVNYSILLCYCPFNINNIHKQLDSLTELGRCLSDINSDDLSCTEIDSKRDINGRCSLLAR